MMRLMSSVSRIHGVRSRCDESVTLANASLSPSIGSSCATTDTYRDTPPTPADVAV